MLPASETSQPPEGTPSNSPSGAGSAASGPSSPAGPILTHARADLAKVAELSAELGISRVLASVLVERGFAKAELARAFLEGNELIPRGALNEEPAAQLLAEAVRLGTSIAIHGDYDCDGVCSTSVLVLGLRAMGATVIPRVPERSDGYGLSELAVRELAATGAGVLIAVDCGITSVAEVEIARSLGMKVVVVDHHRFRADGMLPDAEIVHPNLLDPDALPMCAAAVAGVLVAEVAQRLDCSIADLGIEELMALATVTDLMPLTGMNRTIVRHGLRRLSTTRNPGLAALMDSAGIDRGALDSRTLGFGLGPRINAAGRVRSASAALELLLAADVDRAVRLASELEGANAERRAIQQETLIAAEMQVAELGDRAGFVLYSPEWHKGVVGIVAGAIAGRHHRPTIVLSSDGELATGSARSVPGFSVADAIEGCSDLLERYGGHSAAAGLTVRTDRIDAFASRFAEVVEQQIEPHMRVPRLEADVVVSPEDLTLGLAEELAALEPTGEGNRPPLLALSNVICEKPKRMGDGRHARLQVRSGTASASAVCFNTSERLDIEWGTRSDLAGRLEVNRFRGAEEPRFVIERGLAANPNSVVDLDGSEWFDRVVGFLAEPVPSAGRPNPGAGVSERTAITISGGRSGLLADLGTRESVVFIVSDLDRRRVALAETAGAATALSWSSFALNPSLVRGRDHVVVLDPPTTPGLMAAVSESGGGFLHLLFGDAEIGFALKVHESETDLEPHIRGFYADIRTSIEGDRHQQLAAMRGAGRFPRSPVQVGRMIAVLEEIGAVTLSEDRLPVRLGEPHSELADSVRLAGLRDQLTSAREYLMGLRG